MSIHTCGKKVIYTVCSKTILWITFISESSSPSTLHKIVFKQIAYDSLMEQWQERKLHTVSRSYLEINLWKNATRKWHQLYRKIAEKGTVFLLRKQRMKKAGGKTDNKIIFKIMLNTLQFPFWLCRKDMHPWPKYFLRNCKWHITDL